MGKPVHFFKGASVEEMVNMAATAVIDAQEAEEKKTVLKKANPYSIECFYNYKQSIFRQNNKSIK
jgi:hypothetical protein